MMLDVLHQGAGLCLARRNRIQQVTTIFDPNEETIMRIFRAMHQLWLISLVVSWGSAQAQWPTTQWPKSAPADVGLDPVVLAKFDSDIVAGKFGCVDGLLVIRHGKLIHERTYKHNYDQIYGAEAVKKGGLNALDPAGQYNYFNPWWHPFYRRGDLHSLQSVTKTITSVIIGTAVTRGEFPSLDTPILKFFDTTKVANIDNRKRRITIRHLLTMTAGFNWDEWVPYDDPNNSCGMMEASFDWVQFAVDRPMSTEPGTVFVYNSGATVLLAHIFRVATGKDIEEYAANHLFAPLGIQRYFWKRTPTGVVDAEGGLYLNMYDLAKIPYLFLNNGKWEETHIVSEEWVRASLTPYAPVPGTPYKYGLKWWLRPYDKDSTRFAWMGSGFGGQYPIAIPEYDMVAVFTGWNIVDNKPQLGARVAMERLLEAVMDRRQRDVK